VAASRGIKGEAMRHLLMLGAVLGLAGCSDPTIRLYHPRNGMVATCDVNRAINMSPHANEHCAQEYEQQGYVRGTPPWPPQ
jgi:hypothetical protein